MEQFLSKDLLMPIFLVLSMLMVMKYMPRLMALGIPFVDPKDVKARMDAGENVLVIDVRTSGEFTGDLGHVPGALNIDGASLAQRLAELGPKLDQYKNDPVVVTCRTQNRSPRPARVLKGAGFTDVSVMNGGMSKWNALGFPTRR